MKNRLIRIPDVAMLLGMSRNGVEYHLSDWWRGGSRILQTRNVRYTGAPNTLYAITEESLLKFVETRHGKDMVEPFKESLEVFFKDSINAALSV